MPATVILNPYANRWKCGDQTDAIKHSLQRAAIDYSMHISDKRGHATELARMAVEIGHLPVIAIGGDGTLNEVVNGIFQAKNRNTDLMSPLATIPMGTCNDLATMLDIPAELDASIELIKSGCTRSIDVGTANGHYFVNNAAIGLETEVALQNDRIKSIGGVLRYIVAAVLTIMKRPMWQAEISWDNGHYKGSLTLVSVGNSKRTGGVFYMTPNAIPDDGKLDFIYAPALTRAHLFRLLPKTIKGTHISESAVYEHRTTRLTIRTDPATSIQTDGEISVSETTEIEFNVIPKSLSIFAPQK